jgi:hypothetical protein
MTWIQTLTGRRFDLVEPRAGDVSLEEIAHALSQLCRFTGHCREFYSVAQHSVLVSRLVKPELALAALMHDAHEAYLGDISTPAKLLIVKQPEFDLIEATLDQTICAALRIDLRDLHHPDVKFADRVALATEKRDLMADEPEPWVELPPPVLSRIVCESSFIARQRFLGRYWELVE